MLGGPVHAPTATPRRPKRLPQRRGTANNPKGAEPAKSLAARRPHWSRSLKYSEQARLFASGGGHRVSQVLVGGRGRRSPSSGPLDEATLDQEGLVGLFNR